MTDLPIREQKRPRQSTLTVTFPLILHSDEAQQTNGVPWLRGALAQPAPQSVVLLLRVHNQAGVPIIEGHTAVEIGQQAVVFSTLQPLGIEAYAHKSQQERTQIGQRIWTRRVYGTLTIQDAARKGSI